MRVVIATGGTLGHTKPALQIAGELKACGCEPTFITDRGHEGFISGRGYSLSVVDAGYFRSLLSLDAVLFLPRLLLSTAQSLIIIRRLRADTVLSMGAYAGAPAVLAARMLGVKAYLFEENAHPGRANLLLQGLSEGVFLGFTEAAEKFKAKTHYVGVPVDASLFQLKPDTSKIPPKHHGDYKVLFFGGQNGAADINDALIRNRDRLADEGVFIIHISGERFYDKVAEHYRGRPEGGIVMPFCTDIAGYYAAADLVVCRAGANTVFELSAAGKRAVLVPHPTAMDDHQTSNAQAAEAYGFTVVKSGELAGRLADIVLEAKRRPAGNYPKLARQDSARLIVETLMGLDVRRDVKLSGYSTLGIGGMADYMIFPKSAGQLEQAVGYCRLRGWRHETVGCGSNVLFDDRGFRGCVIVTAGMKGVSFTAERAVADAGVLLADLVERLAERGWGGMEPLHGIPGTVGGAACMNAGCFGVSAGDYITSVSAVGDDGGIIEVPSRDIGFSYRKGFSGGTVVSVAFDLSKLKRTTKDESLRQIRAYSEKRARSRPEGRSAGSVYRNPDGESVGALLERAGLAGAAVGGAQVSGKHCNYILNAGGAKADDVKALMGIMEKAVKDRFGLQLQPEIRIIGE